MTVKTHGPRVWKILYRLVGREVDAADCFQDVFLRAVQAAHVRKIQNMQAFLTVVATRVGIDCLRKRYSPKHSSSSGQDIDQVPDEKADPQALFQNDELGLRLQVALSGLPDLEAQVFSLRALNEFSYRQIADELGISEKHVGVLIYRARTKLQSLLKTVAVTDRREVAQ